MPTQPAKVALLLGLIALALISISVVFARSRASSESGTINPEVRQMKASVRGRHTAPTQP